MKLFNKLALVATIAAGIGLTSCQEELTYEVGAPAAKDSAVVYFANDISDVLLQISDSTIQIEVARFATEAATYDLDVTLEAGTEARFEIPTSVTFDQGDLDTTITVFVAGIDLMRNYTVKIAIDEDWVNPYAIGENVVISFKVMREDYAPYVTGVYYNGFLANLGLPQAWEATLQYSPSQDLYRFVDCWGGGTNVLFAWDKATKITMNPTTVPTGYSYGDYGQIVASYIADKCFAVVDSTTNEVQMIFTNKMTLPDTGMAFNGEHTEAFVFVMPNAEATEQE